MTNDIHIKDNYTPAFKKGQKVVMHSCYESKKEKYQGKIWTCRTDSFISKSNQEVVFLEDFSGYFAAEYLQVVNLPRSLTNIEATERFGQTHGARINKLYWIAGTNENDREFKDLLEYIPEEDLRRIAGDHADRDEAYYTLTSSGKFGLIAEVLHPMCGNFRYDGERPVSWSLNECRCRISYVYAETLEGLLAEIERKSSALFLEYVAKDRAQKAAASDPGC